ncbi:HlyD family type I secretion periplasmic adaptor subunit [Undibacterium sp. TJN25]|uniref:HlyD family type I secretion periplasmic adaptor subunit n=1 Tax=Undibacterium sp. TJN25 TaxID=3413056 RepID=UPI003BF1AB31
MKKLFGNQAEVQDVASHDVTVLELDTDASAHSRLGWIIIILGVGGFLLWAMFAPLDKGVPVNGTVEVATNRKAVQNLAGGTIEEILVKEGDVVKADQVLVKMNNVAAKSAAEIANVQLDTARATEARLLAERDGVHSVNFPAKLENNKNDPRIANNISLQRQLFTARQSSLQSELGAIDENILGLKSQLHGLEESMSGKKQQLGFLKEQLDGMRDLARDGYVARNRLLELERTYAQLSSGISEDLGNIGRGHSQIAELILHKAQRQQDYQKEVRGQLSDVQKEAEALSNRMAALNYDLNNVLVKAPVDGTVVALSVFGKGTVISPGFKMMEVVPSEDALIVEGEVPVNLIDKIHVGLKAELIFSAFNQNQTPHIPGEITQVSADRLVNERTGQPYYKLRAKVAPEGMKMIANLQIRPGMPAEIFVKTGERTMMSYLLKPIFDRAKTSMTEE